MAEDSEDEVELTEIPAQEILGKIQKHEHVKYDHVRIIGDLDLSKLDLLIYGIEITNSQFEGIIDFSNHSFYETSFEGTTFNEGISFERATFFNGGYFHGASFSDVSFERATFSKDTYFLEATFSGETNFDNAKFNEDGFFGNVSFSKQTNFEEATFSEHADFEGATFKGDTYFFEADFIWGANFNKAKFSRSACFVEAIFSEKAYFEGATFNGDVSFDNAAFCKDISSNNATFSEKAYFEGATFNGNVSFDNATFSKYVSFNKASFKGESLTFENAKFYDSVSQETTSRRAKNVLEKNGDREGAGYYFYREMEAKRVQKGIRGKSGLSLIDCLKTDTWSFWKFFWYDAIEWLFVQVMFGYGVHFERLIVSWIVIVVLFAGLYYSGDAISGASNLFDYLKVSFATAIAPGYIAVILNPSNSTGGYRLTSGYYQAAAMVETLLGTFLWAGFVATFAKKYMR